MFLPPYDFAGNNLQSLESGSKIDVLTFSLIATPTSSGAAIFVWHRQHDQACYAFVESLRNLPASEIPHAILRLLFSFCENSYFSPAWWNSLTDEERNAFRRRFLNESLVDDGVRAVNWTVAGFRQ
jgi:hypothetical protein